MEIESLLSVLYDSFGIVNRICWQGKLPPCLLRMSTRLSPRTEAYAQNRGWHDFQIVFNAIHCQYIDDSDFLQIMAHEMIHIWQFSLGRRGGHGRDFQIEQLRLGLILGREIPSDSPMGYVLFMHRLKTLHPVEAARRIAICRNRSTYETEFFKKVANNQHH